MINHQFRKTGIFILVQKVLLPLVLVFGLASCGNTETTGVPSTQPELKPETTSAETSVAEKRVASDGAAIQRDDPAIATRLPAENGTKNKLTFGETIIYGILNDSDTAKALIEKLPYTQRMNRYSHDFCGVTEELPYQEENVHYGWLNGDIDYATDAPYFTILFEDEDRSEQYGYQVNIGVITSPISEISVLDGSYDVLIELDQ